MKTAREKEDLLLASQFNSNAAHSLKKRNDRDKTIVTTSVVGIIANIALAAFKTAVGILSNSIAVVLDAINNLSDAASSVITIVGTKLAGKPADKKHPFGYGRVEYLSAMIISLIVLYAGITSLQESIKKIIHPETPDYGTISLIILAVAVVVKVILGRYVKRVGVLVNSDSLIASGSDAVLDSIISASTLAAAIIYLTTGLRLEAWLGAIIALVIIKSGFGMLKETLSEILGERADSKLAQEIKKTVTSFPNVYGAYDLVLNNYGPDRYNGSIHIEVPDTCNASELDELIRNIQIKVLLNNNVLLTAIGIYSMNTKDDEAAAAEKKVRDIVLKQQYILQMHGFYYDSPHKKMRFDIVISFDSPNRYETYSKTLEQVQDAFPDFTFEVAMDTDFSE